MKGGVALIERGDGVDREVVRLSPRHWAEARSRIAILSPLAAIDDPDGATVIRAAAALELTPARVRQLAAAMRNHGVGHALRGYSPTPRRLADKLPAEVGEIVDSAISSLLEDRVTITPLDLAIVVRHRCDLAGLASPSRLTLTRRLRRHVDERGGWVAATGVARQSQPFASLIVDRLALGVPVRLTGAPAEVPLAVVTVDEATGGVLDHALDDGGPWTHQAARSLARALRHLGELGPAATPPATVQADWGKDRAAWRNVEAGLARVGAKAALTKTERPGSGRLAVRATGPRLAGIPILTARYLAGPTRAKLRAAAATAIAMEAMTRSEFERMLAIAVSVHNEGRLGQIQDRFERDPTASATALLDVAVRLGEIG